VAVTPFRLITEDPIFILSQFFATSSWFVGFFATPIGEEHVVRLSPNEPRVSSRDEIGYGLL
jgi:hypothetical protein